MEQNSSMTCVCVCVCRIFHYYVIDSYLIFVILISSSSLCDTIVDLINSKFEY